MGFASVLTIRRKQTGVNTRRVRLFGWLESQVHEWDTKFIIIGELGLPSVISAPIDVERTGKRFSSIWFTPSRIGDAKIKRPLYIYDVWPCDLRVK